MKKIFIAAIMLITMLSFSGAVYAVEKPLVLTTMPLEDNLTVCLKSNSLIFKDEPKDRGNKSVIINIIDYISWEQLFDDVTKPNVVRTVTCAKGKVKGTTINLTGLLDGKYTLQIGFTDQPDIYSLDPSAVCTRYSTYTHFDIVLKGGKASLQPTGNFAGNLKVLGNERTDIYALDFYKNKGNFDYFKKTGILKQANSIVAGITDDYAKVKAIHDWVANNVWYDVDLYAYIIGIGERPATSYTSASDVLKYKRSVCEGYANLTVALLQAAGFPAKIVTGVVSPYHIPEDAHAWTEVFVDDRWMHMDTTFDSNNSYSDGEFSKKHPCSERFLDGSLLRYSGTRRIYGATMDGVNGDDTAWDGTLVFVDTINFNKVLKEVKNFPLNGVVNSTYGFDIKDLYLGSGKPFKLGKMKVDSTNFVIPVDVCHGKSPTLVQYNVVDFDGYGIDYEGSFYKNFDYNYGEGDYYTDYYGYIQKEMPPYLAVPAGELLKKPVDPVLKGYTFIGWYNADTGKKWNFATNKIMKGGVKLESRWKKAAKSYKVTFDTNKGTSLKPLIIATGSTISKPKDPTRKGYEFLGWYKDAECTTLWKFATNKITANTTLYAKWVKTYTVTCNSNGGTGVFDVVVKANTVATKPIQTVRSGYKFTGWYKDTKCTTLWNFKTDKVTADTTIYAGWKQD